MGGGGRVARRAPGELRAAAPGRCPRARCGGRPAQPLAGRTLPGTEGARAALISSNFRLSPALPLGTGVKTLERHRIDELVRELETDAYGMALGLGLDAASAAHILLEAFGDLAPSLPRMAGVGQLRKKLCARVRRRAPRQEWLSATSDPAVVPAVAAVNENLH